MRGSADRADRADRAQPDRRVDVLEGASIVAFAAVQGATTQTAMPVLRIEADRNVKVSDRSVELPPDLVDRGPTHIDIRVAGGLFEGDVELLDRATIVALADVCGRPVEDGERAGRTDTERGVEIRHRLDEIAHLVVDIAVVVVAIRLVRIECDHAAEARRGADVAREARAVLSGAAADPGPPVAVPV